MEPFRNILVGLDLGASRESLTPGSVVALERVLRLAQLEGARVSLLHSTAADEHWLESEQGFVYRDAVLPDAGRAALEAALERVRDQGIEAELLIREERPDRAILGHVVQAAVDLVLTGKRGEPPADGRGVGSVSMQLLRHCPCPVWVACARASEPSCVLAATDLSEVGDRALRAAGHVAARFDAALHVVHALQLPMSVQMEGEAAEVSWVEERRAEVDARVRALVAEEPPRELEVHVALAGPSAAVLAAVRRFEIGLVVMGTVSRGGVPGLLIGNTAERLLERLDCSLLVVKPTDFPASLAD